MAVGVELDLVGRGMATRALECLCAQSKQSVVFDQMEKLKTNIEGPEARAPQPKRILDQRRDRKDVMTAKICNCLHRAVRQHRPALDALNVVQEAGGRRRTLETNHPLDDGQDAPDSIQHPSITNERAEFLYPLCGGGGFGGSEAEHAQPQCILEVEQDNHEFGRILRQHEAFVCSRPCGEVANQVIETLRRLEVGETAEDLIGRIGRP